MNLVKDQMSDKDSTSKRLNTQRMAAIGAIVLQCLSLNTSFAQTASTDLRAQEYRVQDREGKPSVRVRILGEVRLPGVYRVPEGLTILDLASYAGGPTQFASGDVTIVDVNGHKTNVALLSAEGMSRSVNEGESVVVAKSWRAEAPLVLQIVTAAVSVLTLGLVVRDRK